MNLYGRRWRKLRQQHLDEHPLCTMCKKEGRSRPATELDHIKQHKGDPVLFFDETNLQGLCYFHHRSIKAQMERSGTVRGCGVDGSPLDPRHHWY